jgi:YbbR domain-containing protein
MARRRQRTGILRYIFMAIAISMVLWVIAHGERDSEQNFDISVALHGLPDDMVVTEQSETEINIRVQGSRASLRNVTSTDMEYPINLEGVKSGPAVYDVEASHIESPRGIKVVSRSPARIDLTIEPRGRKHVRIRPDVEGDPADGFVAGDVVVEPERVWLTGARSDVLRLSEVVTETVELTGLAESLEKQVRLSLGGGHVWLEKEQPVTIRVQIDSIPEPEPDAEEVDGDSAGGLQQG